MRVYHSLCVFLILIIPENDLSATYPYLPHVFTGAPFIHQHTVMIDIYWGTILSALYLLNTLTDITTYEICIIIILIS